MGCHKCHNCLLSISFFSYSYAHVFLIGWRLFLSFDFCVHMYACVCAWAEYHIFQKEDWASYLAYRVNQVYDLRSLGLTNFFVAIIMLEYSAIE